MGGFLSYGSITAPAPGAFVITPHNTERFRAVGLYVGSDSTIVVRGEDEETVTFTAVPAGSFIPLRCVQVLATGTTLGTAGTLVGLRP